MERCILWVKKLSIFVVFQHSNLDLSFALAYEGVHKINVKAGTTATERYLLSTDDQVAGEISFKGDFISFCYLLIRCVRPDGKLPWDKLSSMSDILVEKKQTTARVIIVC